MLRAIWFRLRALLEPGVLNAEFDDELRFHVERETAENVKRGLSPAEARRVALADFGGVERFKEGLRDERSVRWLQDIAADLRHGMRLLRKNALFSAAVIGTLALGIGATSTIFTIVNAVLLRPLPYPDADHLVSISEARDGDDGGSIGQHAYTAWRESARSFASVAIYSSTSATFTGEGEPVDVAGTMATSSFFSVLGARVALGRTFTPEEELPGAPRVIVLSHDFWRSTFGGDSGVLNRSVVRDGNAHTVIGVMPSGFALPSRAKYWVPLRLRSAPGAEYSFTMIGRLRQGVRTDAALRELQSLVPRVDALRSGGQRGRQPVLMSLHERLFGSVQKPLVILLAAVCVLLLIACANVANLTLARSAARQREFAVRLALGAGRFRLVRQLLVESSLLAGIGGALGAVVPVLLVGAFVRLSPTSVAGVTDISVDQSVLLFTGATTVVVALLFGLAPALTGARVGASRALAGGSARAGSQRSHNALRSTLVVVEVAAALTLLTGAGLLTKSFARATAVNPGFTAHNVFAANVYLPRNRYPETANVAAFFRTLADRVRTLPGVQVVSASETKPFGGYSSTAEVARSAEDSLKRNVAFADVDAHYGRAAGLHLIAGRFLDATDVAGAPPAVMITGSAARHFFPDQDAVGRALPHVEVYGDNGERPVVVGVVDDVLQLSLDVEPVPQVFLAGAQRDMRPSYLIVRTTIAAPTLRSALKRIISDIDPLQPLTAFSSVEEDISQSVAPRRFNSLLVNAFALLALLLAMIGLYGLMAHAVAARTRELGIRIALGARTDSVLRLILRQGFALVFLGVAVGVVMSLLFSRAVSSLLYNVPAQDPAILFGAPVVLVLVALLACYVPARRATQVSPMTALRQD